MEKIDVIFTTLGSKGDFLPILAYATYMKRRGYKVAVYSNENYRMQAEEAGLLFCSIASAEMEQRKGFKRIHEAQIVPSYQRVYDLVTAEVGQGARPIIVQVGYFSGAVVAAEKYRLPLVRVLLAPAWIPSNIRPPWPMSITKNWLHKVLLRYLLLPVHSWFYERRKFLIDGYNQCRSRAGLKPYVSIRDVAKTPHVALAAFPEWYGVPQKDWPRGVRCVGFPLAPRPQGSSHDGLSDAVKEFLQKRARPLVFTAGTGSGEDVAFFQVAIEVCVRMGLPGILLGGSTTVHLRELPQDVIALDYVDLDALLPHAAALVHHGGIGTVAQAMRAGIPQIIRPLQFDQPDNSHRVEELGLGAQILPHLFGVDEVVRLLKEQFGDEVQKQKLLEVAAEICRNDGVNAACDIIESLTFSDTTRAF